jgi:ArsR family transcriptional regulator
MSKESLPPCCPPASSYPIPSDQDEADQLLASLAKALAHPTRIAILRLLLQRKQCVCKEIVEELPLAQSTVSQHLKQLKEARLIRGEIEGPKVCYCIEPQALDLFKDLLASLFSS